LISQVMSDEVLLSRGDIVSVIQGHTESLKKKVQSISTDTLPNGTEPDLVQAVMEEFRLRVPAIKDDETHASETQVDALLRKRPGQPLSNPCRLLA
jgi:hypothetical protein